MGAVSFVLEALLLAPWDGRNSDDGEISAHRVIVICVLGVLGAVNFGFGRRPGSKPLRGAVSLVFGLFS